MQSRQTDPKELLSDIKIMMKGRKLWSDQNKKAISTFKYLGGDLAYLKKMIEGAPFGRPSEAQRVFTVANQTKIKSYQQFCRLFIAAQAFHQHDRLPADIQKMILHHANDKEENSIAISKLVDSVRSRR